MTARLLALAAILLLVLAGCSDDDPTVPETGRGNIIVSSEPEHLNAPWQLVGPEGFSLSAQGDTTLVNMRTGQHTLTWGDVQGWVTPAAVTQTLEIGGTLTFSGNYVAQPGTITIDPEPDDIDAPWQLFGPADYEESGSGSVTLTDMAPGSYTLTWEDMEGWTTPTPPTETQELIAGQILIFTGTYVEIPPLNTCAATPDELISIFRTIYSSRNSDAYIEVLSDNFLFVTDNRIDTYGYDVEIIIHEAMFNEVAGTDGIVFRNITVDQLDPLYIWQETDPNDEFFGGFAGSQYRDYEVDINFYVAGQNLRFRVQGLVRYYVMQETVDEQICFRFLGMEDYTQSRKALGLKVTMDLKSVAVEGQSWTEVRELFR